MTIMDVAVPSGAERGHTGGMMPSYHHELGEGYTAASYEENPDLAFPHNLAVYDRMRRTDGQVGALLRAINLPILRNKHYLDTTNVRPKIAHFIETELGLPPANGVARPRRASQRGIGFQTHLRLALLALPMGFMSFEKVYDVAPPTAEQRAAGLDQDLVAHLDKLGPRLPRTVQELRVTRRGDLDGIIQTGVGWDSAYGEGRQLVGSGGRGAGGQIDDAEVWIPSRDLLHYAFDQEGADYAGQSILRSVYKDWLYLEQLARINALAAERNGMGVPIVYYGEGGSQAEALAIAQGLRAGSTAGGAVEDGKYRVEILAPQGQVRDVLPSMKHHAQSISRTSLAMFLDLGHDTGLGAGSIGSTFLQLFVMAQQSTDNWFCETTTEGVIRDLVAINFGDDEPYPTLKCDEIRADQPATAEALKALVDAGILTPDDEVEDLIRSQYGLKPRSSQTPARKDLNPPPPPVVVAPAEEPATEPVTEPVSEPAEPVDPAAPTTGTTDVATVPDDEDPIITRAAAALERIKVLRGAATV